MRQLYIVRHCCAEGQEPEASLTAEGQVQAKKLLSFFAGIKVDQIISSPYVRAIESIRPLAEERNISITTDQRLIERRLCGRKLPDWLERLQETFEDPDLCLEGGESSRAAMKRVVPVAEELLCREDGNSVIVSHGNLITLLLKHFDERFGFEEWKKMSNPDVFRITVSGGEQKVERLWK
ncbi:histidine phosphatase family protein [Paenactinomyces guangxiensis]|uniref:Histidine phosphatase family protein n=1 Tax=Paenactinomyces guangxiensis TaxID=1490290 RepID=A0A7W2A8B5_9BACL|nr:histidine phosphatase family protein [Paenactinomyces guangxiensis]MBA4494480.1 histidine phosphatase family protein [Paenactinomyces guangxiensis]MBH8591465.1 histidine phosphatase family protein [Paenactinomyces guangxiensis]